MRQPLVRVFALCLGQMDARQRHRRTQREARMMGVLIVAGRGNPSTSRSPIDRSCRRPSSVQSTATAAHTSTLASTAVRNTHVRPATGVSRRHTLVTMQPAPRAHPPYGDRALPTRQGAATSKSKSTPALARQIAGAGRMRHAPAPSRCPGCGRGDRRAEPVAANACAAWTLVAAPALGFCRRWLAIVAIAVGALPAAMQRCVRG